MIKVLSDDVTYERTDDDNGVIEVPEGASAKFCGNYPTSGVNALAAEILFDAREIDFGPLFSAIMTEYDLTESLIGTVSAFLDDLVALGLITAD